MNKTEAATAVLDGSPVDMCCVGRQVTPNKMYTNIIILRATREATRFEHAG